MDDFSKKGLVEFLDFLGRKGLMNPATISSRKAAVNTLLGVLSEEELADVRRLEIDQVASRFLNLRGSSFKPDSVKVYKARVAAAIQDLVNYRKDPLAFKPAGGTRKLSTPGNSRTKSPPLGRETAFAQSEEEPRFVTRPAAFDDVSFPIPIRTDIVVRLIGIPSNLTAKEAKKIAAVVMALAQDAE